MADILDYETGDVIREGMPGILVCDDVMEAAREIAAERNRPVVLYDKGSWVFHPDGSITGWGMPAIETGECDED